MAGVINTGVKITLQDQVSQGSSSIARGLDEIAASADRANQAFDSQKLEDYNNKLNDIGQSGGGGAGGSSGGAGGSSGGGGGGFGGGGGGGGFGGGGGGYTPGNAGGAMGEMAGVVGMVNPMAGMAMSQVGKGLSGMSNSAGSMASGDAFGVLGSGAQGLADYTAPLGLVGIAAGGANMALQNQISAASFMQSRYKSATQYAGFSGGLDALKDQDMMGADGTIIKSNTKNLNSAIERATLSVRKYGYTMEEGASAGATMLRAGGSDNLLGSVAQYASTGRADIGTLARFQGMSERYKVTKGGSALDVAEGLRQTQNLGVGQFGEVLTALQSSIEQGISQGYTRSMEDQANTLAYFGGMGDTWKGAVGGQAVSGIQSSFAGARNLQSEGDMLKYRAALELTGGNRLEADMLLESGERTEDLMKGTLGQLDQIGGADRETKARFLRREFGLSTKRALDIVDNGELETTTSAKMLGEQAGMTPATQLAGEKDKFAQTMAESPFYKETVENMGQVVEKMSEVADKINRVVEALGEGGSVKEVIQVFAEKDEDE